MRKFLFVFIALAAIAASGAEKKIYAHYMGCAPAGYGRIPWYKKHTAKELRAQKRYFDEVGGIYVNWPLVPEAETIAMEANAEMEIRRAMRFGIDGFAFDAWAGSEEAQRLLDVFFKVAERMKVDFGLTICFDPACHGSIKGATMLEKYVKTAKFVLKHKDSPNMARYDGKPLFFGYYTSGIDYVRDRNKDILEQLEKEKTAWDKFREEIGTPVFIHGSLDWLALWKNPDWKLVGEWSAKTYDAVGGFLGVGWGMNKDLIDAVKKGGKVWAQPMFYQYSNKGGGIITKTGLEYLRENWDAAIANDSRLIQFITWNDYGEETSLAPSTGGGYSVARINKYYIDLWKTGKAEIPNDEIHLFYRRTVGDAESFPFKRRNKKIDDTLEAITLLKAPARVEVKGYGSYDAPAGMYIKVFQLKEGEVAAEVKRDGTQVCIAVGHEKVSRKRWREDYTLVAAGSNFYDEWKIDFGDAKPYLYSENGDLDGDGLPNWFEMVYFGDFPFLETACKANPSDDSDGDGRTNLQEYLDDTDPTKPDTPYVAGYEWDSRKTFAAPYMWNPMRDDKRNIAWMFFYDTGAGTNFPALKGDYTKMNVRSGEAKWRVFYNTNYTVRIHFTTNGIARIFGGRRVVPLVGWKAPCAGEFEVSARYSIEKGGGAVRPLILSPGERREGEWMKAGGKGSFAPFKCNLKEGEFIYFTGDYSEMWGLNPLTLESMKIKKLQ